MSRPHALAVAGVVTLAALLRFPTLDVQSFWLDEAVTAELVDRDLGGVLAGVRDGESTPPLYYVLAWLWAKVFGTGEVGLRALSALLGTLTVPVAVGLGHRAGGPRAAVLAGLLVACSPILVWYSQEARAYALLVLLGSLSVLLALRAGEKPTRGRLLAWGALAALALASHYFAAFLVAPEAVWVAARAGVRRSAPAIALPALAAAALAPLALGQNANDTAAFIRESPLATRTAQVVKQWLVGFDAPAERALTAVTALLVLAGLVFLGLRLRRPRPDAPRGRRDVLLVAGAVAAAVAAPVALALAGEDNVLTRNLLAAVVPALAVLGAGYAAGRAAGLAAAGALCAVWVGVAVAVATDPALQRDDWRGATEAIGQADVARAVVVIPASGRIPAAHYLDGAQVVSEGDLLVPEVDVIALAGRRPGAGRPAPPPAVWTPPSPALRPAGRVRTRTYTAMRFRSETPVTVSVDALAARGPDGQPAVVLFQEPPPARPPR